MLVYLFVFLGLICLYLYYKSITYLVILFLFAVIIIKKLNFKEICLLFILSGVFVCINFNYYKKSIKDDSNYIYVVEQEKEKYLILKQDELFFFVYKNEMNININDKIVSKSKIVSIENTYNDFYCYLNKQKVYYQLESNDYHLYKSTFSLSSLVIYKLFKNRDEKTISNLNLILFNKKDYDNKPLFNNFNLLSCSYLIAISGYQITLLFKLLDKIFFKLGKSKVIANIVIVALYINILNFAVSSYRAFLYYIFRKVINKTKLQISKVELLSAIGIVFLFINPTYIFQMGFIYSFVFSIAIEFIGLINLEEKEYKKKLKTYFYIFLVSVPLILINSYELNMFSLLALVILVKPMAFIYIFSLFTLFLSKFDLIYNLIIDKLLHFSNLIINQSITLVFGKPSIIFIIVYYFLLIMYFISKENKYIFNSKRCFMYLFFCLIFQYSLPYLNCHERITFININQGDCAALFIPNSKSVVLMDAGGSRYKDNATDIIIPYLKSKGIKSIDIIIASHDDFDHDGAIPSLIDNYKVKQVIRDPMTSKVKIGKREFINLNINDVGGNDGSLVLYGEYMNKSFLFTGDISSKVELKIIEENPLLQVDVLKAAHHGSKTSTDEDFIKVIKPSLVVISVGKNNYGHPSEKVLQTLNNYKIKYLRTDINNHIELSSDLFMSFYLKYFK